MPEMTKKEAQAHLTRWLNSGLVEREPFTATFTHTTVQEPCAWTFREVVKALGGWHYPTTEYNWRGTRHLETIASIPDGVKVK